MFVGSTYKWALAQQGIFKFIHFGSFRQIVQSVRLGMNAEKFIRKLKYLKLKKVKKHFG